ncbi:MAG: SIS domain-containing protein [Thermoleophilia bacterium]|nr:SIS domain-containing protein [Thermoleophilia bacterium]
MNQPAFHADILAEPTAVTALLDAYAAEQPHTGIDLLGARRVVLLGMGSSYFAAHAAAVALRARGVDAHVELASAATPMPPTADTIAIGISASGGSEETIEALRRHRGTSRTIAITNAPESAITEGIDTVMPLLCGEEAGGIACRSYLLTLAVLQLLCGTDAAAIRAAVPALEGIIGTTDAWLDPLVTLLDDGPAYVIAPWERLSSALQGALMLREAPRIPADGCETGDWLHVDVYLSKHPDYRAILLRGSRYDEGVLDWARQRTSSIVAVGAPIDDAVQTIRYPGDDDPLVQLLAENTILELAACELWARRISADRMP